MTMRDPDPDLPPRMQEFDLPSTRRGRSALTWILAAVLVLLGAFAFIWSATTPQTARNTDASAPADTTGSAATTGAGASGSDTNAPAGHPDARQVR